MLCSADEPAALKLVRKATALQSHFLFGGIRWPLFLLLKRTFPSSPLPFPPPPQSFTMSFFNYHDIHSQLSVTDQPQANLNLGSLNFKQSIPVHEKSLDASLENSHHRHCEHDQTSFSEHHSCHNIRLKWFLLPAIFALVALGGLLAWSCVSWYGFPAWGVDLMGRALGDANSTSSESPFIRNKRQLAPLAHDLLII